MLEPTAGTSLIWTREFHDYVDRSQNFSGALGLASLVGTAGLALHLLAMDFAGEVLLAGYMGIGGILLGVSFLVYAITGQWHPNPDARQE